MGSSFNDLISEYFMLSRVDISNENQLIDFINESSSSLPGLYIENLMKVYFLDMTYGTDFGARLALSLLTSVNQTKGSLASIITYLSHYPELDSACLSINKKVNVGDFDEARIDLILIIKKLLKKETKGISG